MSTPLVVNSTETLQRALGLLRDGFMRHKYLRISVKTGKARSVKQNNHSHAWYEQLARELTDDDAIGWKAYCKLHFGVPILRSEEEDFRAMYDKVIRPRTYEEKRELMRWLPVTSLMTKAQLKNYETAMQEHFAKQGVILTYDEARIERAAA